MKNMVEQFVKMCELINSDENGVIYFPFSDFEHSPEYSSVISESYPLLRDKMSKLITLINEDKSLIEKDIETELWLML